MRDVRWLAPDHPDATALSATMARRFPHWRAGWAMPADAEVCVVYDGDQPVAGAAFAVRAGRADVTCLSTLREEQDGHALLAALEQAARERGCRSVRLDESSFHLFRELPGGYRTGPAYDGDADVPTWAERSLR